MSIVNAYSERTIFFFNENTSTTHGEILCVMKALYRRCFNFSFNSIGFPGAIDPFKMCLNDPQITHNDTYTHLQDIKQQHIDNMKFPHQRISKVLLE